MRLALARLHDAGHARGVHVQSTVALELPAALAPATQIPMHVPGHYRQHSPADFASMLDRLRQVRIAPIPRFRMKIAPPRRMGRRAQAEWAVVRQKQQVLGVCGIHERLEPRARLLRRTNAVRRVQGLGR
jgi:hypothetical protein